MRFIQSTEIAALGLRPADLVAILEDAFAAAARGDIVWKPKATINQPDGAFLIGALAAWPEKNLGLFHNIMGTAPGNVPPGAPHYGSFQLVSDYRRGLLDAIVDGGITSNLLPGAVTAITARRLARPGSRVAAFIGAGVQARINLDGLRTAGLPIEEVRVASRSRGSAEAFAAEAAASGCRTSVFDEPRAAVEGADVVVTTVPGSPGFKAFLEPSWVAPGAFVSAVDVGRSWKPGFEAFDRIVTDDRAQSVAQHADGRLAYGGGFDTDLPELIAGTRPGRGGDAERIVVIHPGNAVGVLAITAEILARLGGASGA